jgi:tetratricopeptide (TPR) repeat protein
MTKVYHPEQCQVSNTMRQGPTEPRATSPDTPSEPESNSSVIGRYLAEGIAAAESGDTTWARRCFHRVLALQSDNEEAWLWLGALAPTPKGSKAYFEHALALHPESSAALKGIRWAEERMLPEESAGAPGESDAAISPGRPIGRRLKSVRLPDVSLGSPRLGESLRRWRWLLLPVLLCLVAAMGSFWVARTGRAVWARWVSPATPVPTPVPTATPSPEERVASLWPQAKDALSRDDWEKAVSVLEYIREITPSDPQLVTSLASAYKLAGQDLAERDQLEEAIAHFDRAVRLSAGDQALQQARRHAIQYLPGRESYRQGDWQGAIEALGAIFREDPQYLDVSSMLCEAYYQQGLIRENSEELEEAREAYRMAMVANPNHAAAQQRYAIVSDVIKRRKRIEIDVSRQHFTAWENNEVVFSLTCSTGRASTPTKYGSFKVLDKLPEAYSSVWGLRMPWWLGIYWAGASENGIHALPILSNGLTLWSGYLGTPISFGCIVLDTAAAKQVYDWAEIGTIVEVHP